MDLKAYIVHDGNESENAALVFAENRDQARRVGMGFNELGDEYGYFSMRASRAPGADKLLVEMERPAPYIETRGDLLRSLGWVWSDPEMGC